MTRMERIPGPFDGVETEFELVDYYATGTVRVFWPTLQVSAGVTELGANRIELAEAPLPGDLVYCYYKPI